MLESSEKMNEVVFTRILFIKAQTYTKITQNFTL